MSCLPSSVHHEGSLKFTIFYDMFMITIKSLCNWYFACQTLFVGTQVTYDNQ